MGKTKKNQLRVSFIGGNADGVTGSMTLVESQDFKILLECGLVQSHNIRADYYANSRKLPFKAKELNAIFVGHSHIDHIGLIPRLVAEGFRGRIIAPNGTHRLFHVMGLDSAYIMSRDVEVLQLKYGLSTPPVYTSEDVMESLKLFEEYDFGRKFEFNDNISFRFTPSGHIIKSAQVELWLKAGNQTKKLLMTSDLGNVSCQKYYTNIFEPVSKANLVIGEATYGDIVRSIGIKDKEKDLEKIKSVVKHVCIDNKSKVLIPIFSLDRAQNALSYLYDMFGHNKSFCIPVIFDSPLAQKTCQLYSELLTGEQLQKWQEVLSWDKLRFPAEYVESKAYMESNEPCVCLSASGFMTAGRSRQWAKVLLPDSKAHIIFIGYSSENALASKIKYGKSQKTISIDGKQYANRCGITDLHSFSSHMQRKDLLKYYSEIDCEKIALVHSEKNTKLEFAKELQNEISRKNRSGRVVCVNSSTSIIL